MAEPKEKDLTILDVPDSNPLVRCSFRISTYALESLGRERKRRSLKDIAELLERVAADFEVKDVPKKKGKK